ncbi:T-cell immunoglobulin and mucin domain-containing protein 4-like isoform X3 [Myxocyprinus asiaticus]|uniref:T-cell immunoglobulin and mucin domain-containing protein 4-like isoform X3 n=1 Tax=Myxocyprinus asiaticus TaxID=70543 RepID=UPI002222C730|nr:T-cell immunoglobulin and mucin domain-containing protein 4-like isoform X3 [Myxocyprinus asiaticus]
MKDLHRWLFTSWLLCHLTICKCSNTIVQNFEGKTVTLPCKYDSQYHGKCHICWMRGDIPNMGCGDEIIKSDGDKVVMTTSQRYQMTGEIQHGDVSLTILNIQKQDSGKYGCRIHVPGWFNDEMYYVHLIVSDAPTPTTRETTSMTSGFYDHKTTGVFTTAMTEESDRTQEHSSFVSSSSAPESSTIELLPYDTTHEMVDYHSSSSVKNRESMNTSAVFVPVLLLLLALIVTAALLKWKQKRKNRAVVEIAQNSENSVIYSNSGSSLGLYNREMAMENVYQIQTENEYEQWH